MISINIRVAFCTTCRGYYAATPVNKEHCNHPEIIDHFFYHGEPWFTLNNNTFEKMTSNNHTEIRILELSEHRTHDHQYCYCSKKALPTKLVEEKPVIDKKNMSSVRDYYEVYADVYFKDLYHTYNNFHEIRTSGKNSVCI